MTIMKEPGFSRALFIWAGHGGCRMGFVVARSEVHVPGTLMMLAPVLLIMAALPVFRVLAPRCNPTSIATRTSD